MLQLYRYDGLIDMDDDPHRYCQFKTFALEHTAYTCIFFILCNLYKKFHNYILYILFYILLHVG